MRVLAGLVLLGLLATQLSAQNPHPWRPLTAETGQISDVEGLRELAADFPNSGLVRLRMLQPLLAEGRVAEVIDILEWLKERGYVFSKAAQARIPELIGEEHAEAARAMLISDAAVIAGSNVVAEVPARAGLVESVAPIADTGIFAATSIATSKVYIGNARTGWTPLPLPGSFEPSGLVVDDASETIWVALGNVDQSEGDASRFSGLMGMIGDLNQSPLLPAPEGVVPSDLSMGPNGALYTSDPIGGGVYVARTRESSLEELVPPGTFRSPQGSAVSADGKHLYISDYRYGLALIDLESGEVARLPSDVPLILDGVDGLWLHGGELIAVQNGTSPMRISAFKLSEDGLRLVGARILEQANPEWTEPLGGSILDGALYYVGNGQWDRYVAGELREGETPVPTQIRRLELSIEPN